MFFLTNILLLLHKDSLEDIWTANDSIMESAAALDHTEEQKKAKALKILAKVPDIEKACTQSYHACCHMFEMST